MSRNKTTKKILNENWDEILVQHRAGKTVSEIASLFNISRQTLSARLNTTAKSRSTLTVKASSTLYDADGNIKIQWVKEDKSKAAELEAFREAIEAFMASDRLVSPRKMKRPASIDSDTLSVYSIGDAHIGMLAWGEEAGEDYDTDICVADLIGAIDLLVDQAHPSDEAFVIDTGDMYHMDSQNNTTTAGTRVDVDSRFAKIIQAGLDVTVALIDRALEKHNKVNWRSAIGNHNTHTSLYITNFIKAWYRNEPRVVVHDSPAMFMYYQFGKNLIGITHGHTAKAEKLGEIMSVDCKDLWSDTDNRYWYGSAV